MSPQSVSASATATATAITGDQAASTKVHRGAASSTTLREFLAFRLGAAEYGVDMQRVQEIRAYEEPMHITTAPACIKGIVKLRGVMMPVVDMRLKLGLASASCDCLSAVIVLNTGSRIIGLLVDAVSDVITLTQSQMLPALESDSGVERGHQLAIGVVQGRRLILVDIEKLIASPDLGLVEPMLQ